MMSLSLQDVHVHLPGWPGGADAVWDVPGPGDEDGVCFVLDLFNSVLLRFGVSDSSSVFVGLVQRKRIPLKVEKGTSGMNDVDISWIPQETLNAMSTFLPRVHTG